MNTTYFTTPIGQVSIQYTYTDTNKVFVYRIFFEEMTQTHHNLECEELELISYALSQYFEGSSSAWNKLQVVFPKGTDFQNLVWSEIYKVPYGRTKTYAEIADNIGKPKAYRAVANACGKNPILLLGTTISGKKNAKIKPKSNKTNSNKT